MCTKDYKRTDKYNGYTTKKQEEQQHVCKLRFRDKTSAVDATYESTLLSSFTTIKGKKAACWKKK